jgi:hypothetical protein
MRELSRNKIARAWVPAVIFADGNILEIHLDLTELKELWHGIHDFAADEYLYLSPVVGRAEVDRRKLAWL